MKKIISFTLLFVLMAVFCQAQRLSQKINLSDQRPTYTVKKINGCDITVTREQGSGDGMFDVIIEMENQRQDEVLCLFNSSYPEKLLKKRRPTSIRFDKYLMAGDKGHRKVKLCPELPEVQMVEWGNKDRLLSLSVEKNTPEVVNLPIYIAKYKNRKKKRLILNEEKELELTITVEVDEKRPSPYPRLEASCDSLLKELEDKGPFCRSSNHTPRLIDAEKPFKDKIDQLIEEIENYAKIEGGNQWRELKDKLDIDFKQHEYVCVKHRQGGGGGVPPHHCQYCDMSLNDILVSMTTIYNNAAQGKSRSISADRGKMNGLLNCAKKNKNRPSQSGIMSKIEKKARDFNSL